MSRGGGGMSGSPRLHHTNYKQIIYSSSDHDQMAFYIPKEINLGSTMLNCYQYY